ncbi:MAG: GAF domain-containing protein, partial [Cyclobacteriaceae bacterium]
TKSYSKDEKTFSSNLSPIRTKDYFDILPLVQSSEIIHQPNAKDKSWDIPQLGERLGSDINSWVCLPLKGSDNLLGFVLVADKNKRIYDIEDQNVLCCVGSLIRESLRSNFKFEPVQDKVFGIPEVESSKLDDFIFYTAHNLRHPITNLLSLVDLVKHLKDDEEVDEILSLIKVETLKLDDVIRVMIAKIEQDEYKV